MEAPLTIARQSVQVVATFFGFLQTDVFGRRIILIIRGLIMGCSMADMKTYA